MSKIRSSVINIFSGGAGYIIPMLMNLVFTPIIMSNLGREAYGLQSLVNVIIGFLMVADLGLDIPVTKFISEYHARQDHEGVNKILNSTLKIYLTIGLCGMLVAFFLSNWFAGTIFKIPKNLHSDAVLVFMLAGLGFLGGMFLMWGKSVFNGLQRYDVANTISVLGNLFSTLIGVALLIKGYGVVAFVFVKVFFSFATGIAYFLYGKRLLRSFKLTPGFDLATWLILKSQIGYGFLLRISGILSSRMDQTLIGTWIGIAAVGVYAVPYLVTSYSVALISNAVHFLFPMTSALHSTNKIKELHSLFYKGARFIAALSSLIFVPLLFLGDKFLFLWIGKTIGDQGNMVLLLLAIASYSTCLFDIVVNSYLLGIGQIRIYAIFAVCRSIVMTIGCIILIKPLGIEGAGLALLITSALDLVYFTYVVRHFLKAGIAHLLISSFVPPLSLAVLLGGIMYIMRPWVNGWLSLISAVSAFAVLYVSIGFMISVFGETEKKVVSAFWNAILSSFRLLLTLLGL